ncbi:hypothetical protein HYS48_04395 [Candidatus Woesearchaeota archaeon]|nr:hypothetical protein [Candidatus Woesearchaeota archaeon]
MEPKSLKERLLEKGWSRAEAERTQQLLFSPEKQEKHIAFKQETNKIVYWSVILILVILNLLIIFVLLPILILADPTFVEVIVIFLGLIFGWIYNLLISDIEHIEARHHIVAAMFIPAVAILNIFIVVAVANGFSSKLNIPIQQHPIILSITYVTAFLLPYLITLIKEELARKRRF